jgi:hypothetical protein
MTPLMLKKPVNTCSTTIGMRMRWKDILASLVSIFRSDRCRPDGCLVTEIRSRSRITQMHAAAATASATAATAAMILLVLLLHFFQT